MGQCVEGEREKESDVRIEKESEKEDADLGDELELLGLLVVEKRTTL